MHNGANSGINEYEYNIYIEPFMFTITFYEDNFFDSFIDFSKLRHNHHNYELHYFLEGSGSFEVGSDTYPVFPNSYFLIGPGIYHTQLNDNNNPIRKFCFQFNYKVMNRKHFLSSSGVGKEIVGMLTSLTFKHVEYNNNILYRIETIKEEMHTRSILFEQRVSNLFSEILIDVLRSLDMNKTKYELRKAARSKTRDNSINEYFNHNYAKPELTVEQMAQDMNISSRQLNRIILMNFGVSFKQKLIQTRLESAKGLLVSTDLSIESISEIAGFRSAEYFYHLFKQKTGITPGEYKTAYRKGV